MPSLYLTVPGAHATLSSSHLLIALPGPDDTPASASHPGQRNIPLDEIERVIVAHDTSLSTPALMALLERGIPVVFWPRRRPPVGMAVPAQRNTHALAAQLETSKDESARLAAAREIVRAKILNMRRVLQRLGARRDPTAPDGEAPGGPPSTGFAEQAAGAASLDTLRGVEGAASARYFEALAGFFPAEFPFERRSRRPPHNPANSILSFLYTLLSSEMTLHVYAAGLEPAWGLFHENDGRRPALALDLMEPYRAPLCDALALDLLNHHRLTADDFEQVGEGWFLQAGARRRVYAAWETRLEREFFHEQTRTRTTLRRSFEELCMRTRRFCAERAPIEPFLMN
ncbi:MAG: CRISPR-associated endonuclease Cas1 [Puniceicoccales bacterium]|jgi:CRISPR-associated endonuclease Cas1|nr:CRISPR-associated endonuclease Cas1 [Puniceicoccales bacterium]